MATDPGKENHRVGDDRQRVSKFEISHCELVPAACGLILAVNVAQSKPPKTHRKFRLAIQTV